ncbi:MAG TPA: hydroxyacid dehydrogenase, partial [Anaerolineae bacterium]|nr:hydroxyacid dehydrogenase [Anaerolineae bacterium]
MTFRILIADQVDEEGLAPLRPHAEVIERPTISQDDLVATVGDYDALIVRSRAKVTAGVLAAGSRGRLKVVGRAGVGVDNIDVNAATEAGVTVVNAPTGNVVAAAEHSVAMLLSLARHIPAADQSMRAGEWKRNKFLGTEVRGKRLGLIGLGRIASLVAARCQGLSMEVVAYDPYVGKDYAANLNVQLVDLDELLRSADFISIHVPATEQTRDMLDAAALARCKPGVFILNCARGGVVKEAALAAALDSGHVGGAALDVFEHEPPTD